MVKKRIKILKNIRPTGKDMISGLHASWTYLQVVHEHFSIMYRILEKQIRWQDPVLSQWEGAAARKNLAKLQARFAW